MNVNIARKTGFDVLAYEKALLIFKRLMLRLKQGATGLTNNCIYIFAIKLNYNINLYKESVLITGI